MRTTTFILLIATLASAQENYNEDQALICEKGRTIQSWIQQYEMFVSSAGFVKQAFHRSKQTVHGAKIGDIEHQNWDTEVHFYAHKLSLVEGNRRFMFRKITYVTLLSLYHGDGVIVHTINSLTGEYRKVELGSRTTKYFTVIPANTWHAYEFPEHNKEGYCFFGITHLRGDAKESKMTPGQYGDIIWKYPQYENLINKIYRRPS